MVCRRPRPRQRLGVGAAVPRRWDGHRRRVDRQRKGSVARSRSCVSWAAARHVQVVVQRSTLWRREARVAFREEHPMNPSRRAFVRNASLASLAMSMGPIPAWAVPGAWFAADEEVIPFTDIPADFTTKRGDAVVRFDLRELKTWITPNDAFFAVQH